MRIWGRLTNSWIRIRESESGSIRITFSPICRSGSRQIRNYMHFTFLKDFLWVGIRGSGPGVVSHSAALEHFVTSVFDKISTDSRHFSCESGLFRTFGFFKRYCKQLKRWDADLDLRVRILTSAFALVPWEYMNPARHRTTDPSFWTGSAFHTEPVHVPISCFRSFSVNYTSFYR